MVHLLLVEVYLLLALFQLRHIPRVHHIDVIGEFSIEGAFTSGERSLGNQLLLSDYTSSGQNTLKENTSILRLPFFLKWERYYTPTCMPVSSTTMLVDTEDDVE